MDLSREILLKESRSRKFRPEILEKTFRLTDLLGAIDKHPFLKDRIALKGGTALNLFLFNLPRLSVDIDLNYISPSKEIGEERTRVLQAVEAIASQNGYQIRRIPEDHAGGKWEFRYDSVLGQGGKLQIDINFMFRVPLWEPERKDSCFIGIYQAKNTPVLEKHELVAGKLAALVSRNASRDLFDVFQLSRETFDFEKLRTAFVVYGAVNRKDWRRVDSGSLRIDHNDASRSLLPLLKEDELYFVKTEEGRERLLKECREFLKNVLPLRRNEQLFLDELLERGQIVPSLLTDDSGLIERISNHPGLLWKAFNVQSFKPLEADKKESPNSFRQDFEPEP